MRRLPDRYRVWLIAYEDWRPRSWRSRPPRGVALEPAEEQLFTADEAAVFVESFNRTILKAPKNVWAVAIRVRVRCDGDLQPGQPLTRELLERTALQAGSW